MITLLESVINLNIINKIHVFRKVFLIGRLIHTILRH